MLRLMCVFVTVVGIQSILLETDTAADTDSAAQHVNLDTPTSTLIQKATGGFSKLNGLMQPIVDSDHEASETTDPLVWMRMSRDFLAEYVEREVDREKPARDRVLGITFVGESRTAGSTRLVLHPSKDGALGEVVFEGDIRSRTSGRKGPVTLHYLAHSNVRAKKSIVIGGRGLETRPATAQTPTRLTLVDVDTSLPRLRGRIAERIARRRAAASWSQANAVVSDHREHDIRKGLDERLNERVTEIQSQVLAQIAALKLAREDGGAAMQSRSTSQFVEVALYRGGSNAERPAMPQFQVEGNPDIALRVHRSMLVQIVADSELRARLAPLVARSLQSALVVGDESDRQAELNPTEWLRNEWLMLDIVNAHAPTPERVATEDSGKKSLR
jgi:hypothetical protein